MSKDKKYIAVVIFNLAVAFIAGMAFMGMVGGSL